MVRRYIVDIVGDLPVMLMELNGNTVENAYIYANNQILAQGYVLIMAWAYMQ